MKTTRHKVLRFGLLTSAVVLALWLGGVRLFAFSGRSMEPTVMPGDYFVGLVGILGPRSLNRFDMVIFEVPPTSKWAGQGIPWMKRLVGLPGERVQLAGSQLLINGQVVDSPYFHRKTTADVSGDFDIMLKPDEYFVLGDNLDHSLEDSRTLGPISRSLMRGRLTFVLRRPRRDPPNKAPEPTPTAVTIPANAGLAPAAGVAHL